MGWLKEKYMELIIKFFLSILGMLFIFWITGSTTNSVSTGTHTHAITGSGTGSLEHTTTGACNAGIGIGALNDNVSGDANSAIGYDSLASNTTGYYNNAIEAESLLRNTSGVGNTAIGLRSLGYISTGYSNIGIGAEAGYSSLINASNTTGNNSIFIGNEAKPYADAQTNQIVIGHNAVGNGSNTVTIGSTSITDNYFNGVIHSNGQTQKSQTLTSSATPTFNYLNGANAVIILTATVTSFTMSNVPDGGRGSIVFIQDSDGGNSFNITSVSHSGLTVQNASSSDVDQINGQASNCHNIVRYERIGSFLYFYMPQVY